MPRVAIEGPETRYAPVRKAIRLLSLRATLRAVVVARTATELAEAARGRIHQSCAKPAAKTSSFGTNSPPAKIIAAITAGA